MELHLGPTERGKRTAVGSQRPPDLADPAANGDDLDQEVLLGSPSERQLVELVDLALDPLDELEVAGDDLVGDSGHEPGRVKGAEPGLAFRAGIHPLDGGEGSVMDSHDPVASRHDVDEVPGGLGGGRGGAPVGPCLHRLEDEVDVFRELRQVDEHRSSRQAFALCRVQANGGRHVGEHSPVAAGEIDPQQLSFPKLPGHPRLEIDFPIASVRVVESNARAGAGVAGCGRQRSTASRAATTIAKNAVAYCSTSIERSVGSLAGSSTVIGCGDRAADRFSIDVCPPGPSPRRHADHRIAAIPCMHVGIGARIADGLQVQIVGGRADIRLLRGTRRTLSSRAVPGRTFGAGPGCGIHKTPAGGCEAHMGMEV